jgi:hypothetical protein
MLKKMYTYHLSPSYADNNAVVQMMPVSNRSCCSCVIISIVITVPEAVITSALLGDNKPHNVTSTKCNLTKRPLYSMHFSTKHSLHARASLSAIP